MGTHGWIDEDIDTSENVLCVYYSTLDMEMHSLDFDVDRSSLFHTDLRWTPIYIGHWHVLFTNILPLDRKSGNWASQHDY